MNDKIKNDNTYNKDETDLFTNNKDEADLFT